MVRSSLDSVGISFAGFGHSQQFPRQDGPRRTCKEADSVMHAWEDVMRQSDLFWHHSLFGFYYLALIVFLLQFLSLILDLYWVLPRGWSQLAEGGTNFNRRRGYDGEYPKYPQPVERDIIEYIN